VLNWNTPAIEFYQSIGAGFTDEWRNMSLNSEAIARIANPSVAHTVQKETAQ
jgi:ribosomal protein S18 acetylase RimI-like enzyme